MPSTITRFIKHFLLGSSVSFLLTSPLSFAASQDTSLPNLTSSQLQQQATVEILKTLDRKHFVDLIINDDLSARFMNSYLDRLDPTKSYFLQSDIDEFNQQRFLLDDQLKKGENKIGFAIYRRLQERMNDRLSKVINDLSDNSPINFTIDEQMTIDDDNRAWPSDMKAADELWRKRIKSSFLAQKLAGDSVEKTRESLIKRYTDQRDRLQKSTSEDVYEIYINSFTELYDPHTNYFSPRSSESFSIRMSLSLEGIGAVLQSEDGYTKVIRIVAAGPADKQGQLKPSDKISGVAQGDDGEIVNVVGWRLDEVVDLIRGPKDSIVRLEVASSDASGAETTKIIRIKRDKVKLEDQAAQKAVITVDDNGKKLKLGIINIPTFYLDFEAYRKRDPNFRSTSKDVYRLLQELNAENVDGIVVDLRNNGGGSLLEATAVTDLFINRGPVVQIGKDGGRKQSQFSHENAAYNGPLVVLINRLSASASEIFAGAIQDYHRGLVVGSQSFGKGTVQTLTPLQSQGELKVTESKFYRVSGDSTQHRGVIPDILMPELIDNSEVGESSYDTALPWSQTEPVRHGVYRSLDPLLGELTSLHDQRIRTNPDFIYLNERKALQEEQEARQTISLKESTRLKEKAELEQRSLTIENKRRKAKGQNEYKDFDAYETQLEKDNEERAANAGTTTIDTQDDAILKEAGYILKDYIHLLDEGVGKLANNPKK